MQRTLGIKFFKVGIKFLQSCMVLGRISQNFTSAPLEVYGKNLGYNIEEQ